MSCKIALKLLGNVKVWLETPKSWSAFLRRRLLLCIRALITNILLPNRTVCAKISGYYVIGIQDFE